MNTCWLLKHVCQMWILVKTPVSSVLNYGEWCFRNLRNEAEQNVIPSYLEKSLEQMCREQKHRKTHSMRIEIGHVQVIRLLEFVNWIRFNCMLHYTDSASLHTNSISSPSSSSSYSQKLDNKNYTMLNKCQKRVCCITSRELKHKCDTMKVKALTHTHKLETNYGTVCLCMCLYKKWHEKTILSGKVQKPRIPYHLFIILISS